MIRRNTLYYMDGWKARFRPIDKTRGPHNKQSKASIRLLLLHSHILIDVSLKSDWKRDFFSFLEFAF